MHPADVSRYAGRYEHVFESTTAGVTIQAPQLDINTVAAGGGSRLFFRSGLFQASRQGLRGCCCLWLARRDVWPAGRFAAHGSSGRAAAGATAPSLPAGAAGGPRVGGGAPRPRVLPQARLPGHHRWGG